MPQLPQPPPPTTTTCYRHPGREAGRRCTRCGRPACSECLVQAAVGSHCVECARAARPNLATRVRYANARQPTLVTYALIGLNVAVFVYLAAADRAAVTSSRTTTGQVDLALSEQFLQDGEWWRMVTAGFLHYGIIHLAFNMFLLFQLGQLLEPAVGRVRFALLYAAALVAGSAGAMLLQPGGLHGGASGAVFGLMAAAIVGLRHRGVNPWTTGVGTALFLNLMITFTIPGISIGGHLGGIVGGAVAGWTMLLPTRGRSPWMDYVAPAAVIVASFAVTYVAVG